MNGKQVDISSKVNYDYDFSTSGNKIVRVSYEENGISYSDLVQVVVKQMPSELLITSQPDVKRYFPNNNFNPYGIKVMACYPDGTKVDVTNEVNYDYDFSTTGDKTVSVFYEENGSVFTQSVNVTVLEDTNTKGVYISPINITDEEMITVPVRIYQNPGFMGFAIKLEYDKSIFTPVSVTAGELIQNGFLNDSIESTLVKDKNNFRVIWTGNGDEKITEDGILFYVQFQVNKTSEERSIITLSYSQDDTYDENFETVELTCSPGVVTFASDIVPTFYADSINITAGNNVTIPISVSNPCELSGFELDITFLPSQFTFVGVDGDVDATVSDSTIHISKNASTIIFGDNIVFNITFAVNSEAVGEAILGVSVVDCDFNGSGNAMAEDISVIIIQPITETKAEIYTTEMTTQTDSVFYVPVYIRNNEGMMGFSMNLNYDNNVLILKTVNKGDVLASGNFDTNLAVVEPGQCKIVWSYSADVSEDGLLFMLEFEALPEVTVAETEVLITCSQDDTFNEKWEDVELEINAPFATIDLNIDRPSESTESFTFINGLETFEKTSVKYVYGIQTPLTSAQLFQKYITSKNVSVYVSYATNTIYFGTDSKIEVRNGGNDIIDSYTILIFGDVNGDGWYDGQDAVLVSCIANDMLTREQVGEAVWLAADCNHDGEVNEADVALLNEAGALLANVNQTLPAEELMQTESYIAYASLIEQDVVIEEDKTPNEDTAGDVVEDVENTINTEFDFIVFIENIIKEIIAFIQRIFNINLLEN